MECPYCRIENSSDALECAHCGKLLSDFSSAETRAAETLSAKAASATHEGEAKTLGVMTPPPAVSGGSPPGTAPPDFSVALGPGDGFGPRYQIVSLLGKGGMGLVYKAHDLELDRTVAIKLVRPELTVDSGAMQRFKQELLLASRISHKNVLRIHDLGEVGGVKFISMAYVEGDDLSRLLKKRGRLALDETLKLARQLCAALDAAHGEGIIHRDLKPQNVLIDPEGNAFVSDFGLAKSLETSSAEMTQAGQILGTPRYMSPEQMEGKPVDARADIYALGLMLYEMVTGDIPFKANSMPQLMLQRITTKAKDPKALNPETPDYMARTIMRCLETDPDRRYPSAREILKDLDSGHAAKPARSSVQITVAMPAKRSWLYAAGAAALVGIALAVFLARKFTPPHPARPAAAVAAIPPLSRGKYVAVLPFRVLGSQASLGYLAEGVNEALSAKLFSLHGVHLVSASAALGKSTQEPLSKVARDLGVNLAVRGTLQGDAGEIAIVVNLEDPTNGRLLWAQEFTGSPKDLLSLEDHITASLIAALQLHPGPSELARSTAHPTENVAAYGLYLKGQDAMRGMPGTTTVQKAIDFYQGALKNDPGFALAYAGLAGSSLRMYQLKKDRFWADQALSAAEQAQELNSSLPEVYLALGNVYRATGKSAEAIEDLKRALALAPNSDEGYRLLGQAYEAEGAFTPAIGAFKKAVQIDPYYWVNPDQLGNAYDAAGSYALALRAFQRVAQLAPDNAAGYENVGNVYMQEGEFAQAIPSLKRALQLRPAFQHYSNLGVAYLYTKRYGEAVKALEEALALSPNQEDVAGNLAEALLFSGQKEKAQQMFNRAIGLAYKDLQVNPRDADTMADLALYWANEGQPGQALQTIQNSLAIDPGNPQSLYNEAIVEGLAARPEKAIQALGAAFQKGFPPLQAASDPQLAILQRRPDFKQLVDRFSHNK
ncbi:MAG: protein kinase domain-containing protein [Terriglobia bacterium]